LPNFSFDYDMADSKSLDRVIHRLSGESVRSLECSFSLVEHLQTPTLVDNLTERQQTPASPSTADSSTMDLYGSVNLSSPAYGPSAENNAYVATVPASPSLTDWVAETSLDEDDSIHYPSTTNRRYRRAEDSVHCALLTPYPGKKNWDSSKGCWVPKKKSRRSLGAWLNDDITIANEAESPSNVLSTRRLSSRPSMTTERYVPETIPFTGTHQKKKKKKEAKKLITDVELEFEKIIGHRYDKKKWEIEVRWHGVHGTSWEPLRRFCKSNVSAQSACFRYADRNGLINKWKGVLLNR
jgi:hypothetical protein